MPLGVANNRGIVYLAGGKGKRKMQVISSIIQDKQLATGENSFKPTVKQLPTVSEILSKEQVMACDIALSDYQDIISGSFKEWYCKAFYELGAQRFTSLAAIARADGKNPARLFSYLIKKELSSD